MRALTVRPGTPRSLALSDIPEPDRAADELLVQGLAMGVCGTDLEIVDGKYGWAPPGAEELVLGHESLGRVLEAPQDSGFATGDLVAGVVRRPDPEPCGACARGEFDMCRNGGYTERGIKEIHGFGSERWVVKVDYAVAVDASLGDCGVLMEPTSVVAKAWEQIERVGDRAWFEPRRVLVTGAGPIGLLAALLARQRGLDVHVLDLVTEGPKPGLVRDVGATYHSDPAAEVVERLRPDVVIEATGVGALVFEAMAGTAPYGIVCLTGVSSGGQHLRVDAGMINRDVVLENDAVVGSVNANVRHYALAAEALARADRGWLDRLLTRRVPLERFAEAFRPQPDDVKTVLTLS
jgi:threonine dehydrogenase-like Zn-dependent dehydrogenase